MHIKMMHTIFVKKNQPPSYLGTCKMRNETRNGTKQNKIYQSETKRNLLKRNGTKRNATKKK